MRQLSAGESTRIAKEAEKAKERYIARNTEIPDSETDGRTVIHVGKRGNSTIEKVIMGTGAAVIGTVAIVGAYAGIQFVRESEAGRAAAESVCDDSRLTAQVLSRDACHVVVPSAVRFKPIVAADGAITGAAEYELSTLGVEGSVGEGSGRALKIEVSAHATNRYPLTSASTRTAAELVSARGVFNGLNEVITGENQAASALAMSDCYLEIDTLMQAVRNNAEVFATDNFPAAMLEDEELVGHRTYYSPHTDKALPDTNRREIVFVDENKPLTCLRP